ncbi:hypothetical protein Pcinc_005557 [Petrolisthes cinctipes]|uniref:Reverse transcriptase domain-containing protein n=1 Tax=Petrolisthes cinctipes TaxID=88211 RepID=A0AAE1GEW4_PETCI|nr:hypothetical protein Pcinc_005557 [Petrolisthes cinctipes]
MVPIHCRAAQREKQEVYCQWSRLRSQISWDVYVRSRSQALITYATAQTAYNDHLRDVLTGASLPHSWWSALKQSLFDVDSGLPPLSCSDGFVCHNFKEKADLLAAIFNNKQSNDELPLPSSCDPPILMHSLAFKSSELLSYLNDLDSFGDCDLKGSSPSIHPEVYRPISITPVLSKIFELLLAKLPDGQFGFRKGLSTSDALLFITHNLQSSLDTGHESRLVSLDFSSAFDCVNNKALVFKIRCLDMWSEIESNMVAYADDTTLFAAIPSPQDRQRVADLISRDVSRIQAWCDRWGMKLNPSKSQKLIISRPRTLQPPHPDFVVGGVTVPNCVSLKLLGDSFDAKLSFKLICAWLHPQFLKGLDFCCCAARWALLGV